MKHSTLVGLVTFALAGCNSTASAPPTDPTMDRLDDIAD
jgi:hypothetical protein